MSKMIAFCGLVCSDCPTYIATKTDDNNARAKTAQFYNEKFGFDCTAEDINCDGCRTPNGRKMAYCQDCEIRECGTKKGVENCFQCAQAPCDKLDTFFEFSPDAKKCFEALGK